MRVYFIAMAAGKTFFKKNEEHSYIVFTYDVVHGIYFSF